MSVFRMSVHRMSVYTKTVCRHCTLSRGSLYEVVFSDIIIIITIIIIIICLFAAVVPPMEGTTDSVHFG